jgi:hypothetical protein
VIETIKELQLRLDGLIESLETVDMEEEDLARQFVENKYLVVALHVHTETEKLQRNIKSNSEKLKYKKQLNLYQLIESILSSKCNELTVTEMVSKLNECKELAVRDV